MALRNEQYDRILREYDRKQLENHQQLQDRQKKVYATIPVLRELETEIASNAVKAAKLTLMGDETALEHLRSKNAELSEAKEALLVANGYPKDYLSLQYSCPDCKDTGYVTDMTWTDEEHVLLSNNKCHCFKQAIVNMLYQQSNIQNAIKKENFSTFSYDYFDQTIIDETTGISSYENIVYVVNACQNFVQNFDEKFENILFYGNPGSGKTFLSNCIAKELLDSFHTVIYLTAFELFRIFEKYKFQTNKDFKVEEQYQGITDCDLLIIDDLGTEFHNNFTVSQLYNCVNERLLTKRSTIISTNLSIDEIKQKYSERILSRLMGNYSMHKLFGNDIRIQKQLS